MASPEHVYWSPHDRVRRLHQLGLTEAVIHKIVAYGHGARSACTALHPPSFPGYIQWGESTYAARVELVPRGWTPDDTRNFSRVLRPDGLMALTVSTGDDNTGKPGLPEPRSKHPHGSETRRALKMNRQITIFDDPGTLVEVTEFARCVETWTLLLNTTETELHYELSLGADQDAQGRITRWAERVLFPPLDLDRAINDQDDDDDDDGPTEIDVHVERL